MPAFIRQSAVGIRQSSVFSRHFEPPTQENSRTRTCRDEVGSAEVGAQSRIRQLADRDGSQFENLKSQIMELQLPFRLAKQLLQLRTFRSQYSSLTTTPSIEVASKLLRPRGTILFIRHDEIL